MKSAFELCLGLVAGLLKDSIMFSHCFCLSELSNVFSFLSLVSASCRHRTDSAQTVTLYTHCTDIAESWHRCCPDTAQNCTDTVQTLCKHGALHKHCTVTVHTLGSMAQTVKRHCAHCAPYLYTHCNTFHEL